MRLRDLIFRPTTSRRMPGTGGAAKGQAPQEDAGPESQPGSGNNPDGSIESSALNAKIVQAASFTNTETARYLPDLVRTPPEVMAAQAAGIAVQDAATYMNAVMQIALAAQAVIAKKAAEGPLIAIEEVPALLEMQKMVSAAVEVYGAVSKTAGTSEKTIVADISEP